MRNTDDVKSILSRVCYCEKCAKAGRPTTKDKILLWGSSHEGFFWIDGDRVSAKRYGFVPHLIVNYGDISLPNEKPLYDCEIVCAVLNCGVYIGYDENGVKELKYRNTRIKIFTHKDFEALINFTDTGYEI